MFPSSSKGADVNRQASAHKQPKEPKAPKDHWWNAPPKITRDPNVTRRLQQGWNPIPPPPISYSPVSARDPFDAPPPYSPLEPARPSHGPSDEGRSRRDDNGLRRVPTTHRQQRSVGTQTYSQRETEGLNRGYGDEGRSRHDDRSQRGSEHDSRRGDQHGSQRSSQKESRR